MNRDDKPMTKRQAKELLGGTYSELARAIGITPQAVHCWPDPLTPVLRDRVYAALWRQHDRQRRDRLERFALQREAEYEARERVRQQARTARRRAEAAQARAATQARHEADEAKQDADFLAVFGVSRPK